MIETNEEQEPDSAGSETAVPKVRLEAESSSPEPDAVPNGDPKIERRVEAVWDFNDPRHREEFLRWHGDQRSEYVQGQEKAIAAYDKALLWLSAGGLGITLVFLKDIIGPGRISFPAMLCIGWIAMLVSLGSILRSHYASYKSFQDHVDAENHSIKTFKIKQPSEKWGNIVDYWNGWSGKAFAIGTVAILLFSYLNLLNLASEREEQAMSQKSSGNGGSRNDSKKAGVEVKPDKKDGDTFGNRPSEGVTPKPPASGPKPKPNDGGKSK